MSRILAVTDQTIAQAAEVIKSGGLVAMPTETVYGLAANALDGKAVARVYEAKGRPAFNPLISHYTSIADVQQDIEWNEHAQALADSFWPGPLTLILPRKDACRISELATAGLPTIAVRIPSHPAAQALLKAAGLPLVAPSANKSGQISPTTPAHVADSMAGAVDIILAGGASKIGLESTVLDLSTSVPTILRPGAILAEDIARVLDTDVMQDFSDAKDAPKSPGQMLRHYAPNASLRLNAIDLNPGEALLAFSKTRFMGIKGGGSAADLPEDMIRNLSEDGDLHEAAANLFAMLKDLDRPGQKAIAVMPIPDHGLGIAINDRLKRAAVRE